MYFTKVKNKFLKITSGNVIKIFKTNYNHASELDGNKDFFYMG